MTDYNSNNSWPAFKLAPRRHTGTTDVEWNVKWCKRSFDQRRYYERARAAKYPTQYGGRQLPAPIPDTRLNDGGQIGKLFVTYGNEGGRALVEQFMRNMLAECQRKGIEIEEARPPQQVDLSEEIANRACVFRTIAKETEYDEAPPIVVYVDQLAENSHGQLKVLEVLLQLRTQHVNSETVERYLAGDSSIMSNIVKQLNMKIGGVNYDLDPEGFPTADWLSEQTLIIGYCVAHPAVPPPDPRKPWVKRSRGYLGNNPSIIAFSSNCAENPGAYISDYHYQEAMCELVSPAILRKRMRWMLELYKKNRGCLPEHILIIRDGLTRKFLERVVKEELSKLQAACREFQKEYAPKFVVVGVTHGSSNYKAYQILYSYKDSITLSDVTQVLYRLGFTHQMAFFKINVPRPVYEAIEWTKRGAKVFEAFRDNGFVLPRLGGAPKRPELADGQATMRSTVDWEKVTAILSYMGKKLEGLRIKV